MYMGGFLPRNLPYKNLKHFKTSPRNVFYRETDKIKLTFKYST